MTEHQVKQLVDLPVEVVPILTGRLNALDPDDPGHPVFDLLALKFGLLEEEIQEPDLSRAVDALLAKAIIGEKKDLDRKAISLSGIKNTRIKEMVAKMRYNPSQVSMPDAGALAQNPAKPITSTATPSLPQVEPLLPVMESQANASNYEHEPTTKGSAFPLLHWFVWGAAVIAAIGLLLLFKKWIRGR